MKPAWDSLMEEFAGHATVLVGDADCTGTGKELCAENGVQGYPTVKYGDPSDLEKYTGPRDAAALAKFASELKPLCSPVNMDLCDEEGKAKIAAVQALSDEELDAQITAGEAKSSAAEAEFEKEVATLQATYDALNKKKEADVAAGVDDAEATFKAAVTPLQSTYRELSDTKQAALDEVKASGIGLLKSVKASRASSSATAAKEEL